MNDPGYYGAGNYLVERITGFILFLVPAWYFVLKPALCGLNQALGRADPLAEAMDGLRGALGELFADIKGLAQASVPGLLAKAALGTLEDLFAGRAAEAARDIALLIDRAGSTWRAYQERWEPCLTAVEGYPAAQIIAEVHGFWSWLSSPEVLPVAQAAGRRFGLGPDVAEERRRKLRDLVAEHAPALAHGFWYGLYAPVGFQLLVLEILYAWGRPRPLFWAAGVLAGFNLVRGALLLRDAARLWPVRAEAAGIAATVGIPNLGRYAARLLAGQFLGMVTMVLLVVRFLALGEALQHSGTVLSGLHHTLGWVWDFYLALARVVF